ncbi:MAG TPA: hypothetical protein VD999_01570 [Vitreimonas sp.]|nr:hypothetical protein [Vitreimonas sp.]
MEKTLTPNSQPAFSTQVVSSSPAASNSLKVAVVGLLMLLPVVAYGGYYFGRQRALSNQVTDNSKIRVAVSPTPTSASLENDQVICTMDAKVCPDGSAVGRTGPNCEFAECPAVAEFKKRLFDSSAIWFVNRPYPSEMTQLDETKLVGLDCSEAYILGGPLESLAYFTNPSDGSNATQLSDPELLKIPQLVTSSTGKNVNSFVTCDTATGMKLLEFEEWAGGGGSRNKAFFGVIENNSFTQWAELPTPGLAYFSCFHPLQFTTTKQWYFQCGGGDGGGGGKALYRIDGANNKIQQLEFCTSSVELGVSCK